MSFLKRSGVEQMGRFIRLVDRARARTRTRSFKARVIVYVAVISVMMLLTIIPNVTPAPPTVSGPGNIKVKGADKTFSVTIKVTSNENGTYRVQINDIESVTLKFNLVNNGVSENKTLAPGATHNFSVQMRTRTASLGQTNEVPFNVYQNDVLVRSGKFNVTVETQKEPNPSDINCSACGLVIPPLCIGGLYIATTGKWKMVR